MLPRQLRPRMQVKQISLSNQKTWKLTEPISYSKVAHEQSQCGTRAMGYHKAQHSDCLTDSVAVKTLRGQPAASDSAVQKGLLCVMETFPRALDLTSGNRSNSCFLAVRLLAKYALFL